MAINDGDYLIGERRSIDRTGLERIVRRVYFGSYDAAVAGVYGEVGGEYDGALFVGGGGSGDESGSWVCDFNYEKVVSGDNASDDIGLVEELDYSMKQDPISSHPRFAEIRAAYPWDEVAKAFKDKLASGQDSPVYGTTDYLNFSCVYRQTRTLSKVPGAIFGNIGAIDDNVPFVRMNDPASADDRTWLYLAPKISSRGNAFVVAQEWMLSGPGGWNEDIYSIGALSMREAASN